MSIVILCEVPFQYFDFNEETLESLGVRISRDILPSRRKLHTNFDFNSFAKKIEFTLEVA
jgi:hypothetical protein